MDVVRRIRKASNIKRVGHGGTLDPFASGVLPIAIGSATRLLEYMLNGDKAYDAEIELGRSTDSYDKSVVLTDTGDTSGITHKDLIKALKEFEGDILQIPPMFSAIKSKGKKLYELARQGIEIERKARQVSVNCLELIDFKNPFVRIRILCGKGFYVRSLANDPGNYLGCGGTLIKLRREYSSGFLLEESHELVEVEKSYSEGNWEKVTEEPGNCLPNASHIDLTTEELAYVSNGREITAEGKNDPSITYQKRYSLMLDFIKNNKLLMLNYENNRIIMENNIFR